MQFQVAVAGLCALGSMMPCAPALAASYSFTTISPPGSTGVKQPLIINDGGLIAGSYDAAGGEVGFALSGGAYTVIQPPGTSSVQVMGINNAGQIVGSCFMGNAKVGFIWQDGATQILQIPGAADTGGLSINESGEVILIGDVLQKKHYKFFSAIYKNGTYTTLHLSILHEPTFIDDSGTLYGSPQHFKPDVFKYIPGGKVMSLNKDFPDATVALISQVSSAGLLAGYYESNSATFGFTLTGNTLTTYSAPGSTIFTSLNAVASNGLVAGYADKAGSYAGFVTQGTSYTFLKIPGNTDTFVPTGINASGTVVGQLLHSPYTAYVGETKN